MDHFASTQLFRIPRVVSIIKYCTSKIIYHFMPNRAFHPDCFNDIGVAYYPSQQQCHIFDLSSGRGSNQPDTATMSSLCLVFWTRFKPARHSNSVISLTSTSTLLDEVQTSQTQQQCYLFDLSSERGSNQPDTVTVSSLRLVFWTRFKPA